ncbi:MAG: hypothetical protein DCF20_13935 [Pseudanabaena sp.]|nr:MAG: hypothetical protein DCF20_13935 [Pseudanabaena sp.]
MRILDLIQSALKPKKIPRSDFQDQRMSASSFANRYRPEVFLIFCHSLVKKQKVDFKFFV